MTIFRLLMVSAATATLAATGVDAQIRPVGGGSRITLPSPSNHFSWERGHGFKHGFPGVWIVEREVPVIVEKEVVKEVPVPTPGPSPEGEGKKRKPYVVGATYASLPGGCMKMIESGAAYYYCSGEWYRQVREGRSPLYQAVARKL